VSGMIGVPASRRVGWGDGDPGAALDVGLAVTINESGRTVRIPHDNQ